MKLIKVVFVALFFSGSISVHANQVDCNWLTIEKITVVSEPAYEWASGHYVGIMLGQGKSYQCNDISFAYIDINDPAFDAVFEIAKDAYKSGEKVRITVHEKAGIYPGYRQLEFIQI